MKAVLAQLNPVVGDLAGNLALAERTLARVQAVQPDLVVFPELFVTGYPPRDLLEREWFVDRAEAALGRLVELSARFPGVGVLAGAVVRSGRLSGRPLQNVAVLCEGGRELFRQAKSLLPTYDVFDEARYFEPAESVRVFRYRGETLGVSVCEDAWNAPELWGRQLYQFDPLAEAAKQGATLLVNISASPFTVGKQGTRYGLYQRHARRLVVPVVFVDQVGANDELVFDGSSMAFDRSGRHVCLLPPFAEATAVVDTGAGGTEDRIQPRPDIELVHDALVLGIGDYARKCGFGKAVLGLSGGIDSAVTCCLAVAALGPENVLGVTMPSEYSSAGSVEDSRRLARNLGIELSMMPISGVYRSYLEVLRTSLAGRPEDVTEENIQARVRGNILMALSNRHGHLVLTTGNKSELAVGYCTMYGDMSGGLAVLADVPKTMVYDLARYLNRERELVPASSIEKPPSAELRSNQTDQDTLPPYPVLDAILERYVDEGQAPGEIAEAGFDPAVVDWVVRQVDRNEYKRRQAAPGLKVTAKAFGMGRRFPVAARYEH
ncbi:NAD+ synthase [candidate division WOR-3 bacterium]|nr:NAD+ synthase [candidate division WOR-3 bacterium]